MLRHINNKFIQYKNDTQLVLDQLLYSLAHALSHYYDTWQSVALSNLLWTIRVTLC